MASSSPPSAVGGAAPRRAAPPAHRRSRPGPAGPGPRPRGPARPPGRPPPRYLRRCPGRPLAPCSPAAGAPRRPSLPPPPAGPGRRPAAGGRAPSGRGCAAFPRPGPARPPPPGGAPWPRRASQAPAGPHPPAAGIPGGRSPGGGKALTGDRERPPLGIGNAVPRSVICLARPQAAAGLAVSFSPPARSGRFQRRHRSSRSPRAAARRGRTSRGIPLRAAAAPLRSRLNSSPSHLAATRRCG